MKSLTPLLTLFLYSFTFNIFAQDACDAHKLPERIAPFFLYGIDIDQAQLDKQINFQVEFANHVSCTKDSTGYKQIELLTKYKKDKELQIKAAADSNKKKELEKALEGIVEQLSKYEKKRDTLQTNLISECKIPPSVRPILNVDLPKCLTLLKQQLENEVKQYPFNEVASNNASAAEKKDITNSNTKNKNKRTLAMSDLNMVKSLLPSDSLEESPSSIGILKNTIREGDFGANANILLDILDAKSAEVAIFRQKIKVLERNSRVLISKSDFNEKCKIYELYEEKSGLLSLFSKHDEKVKNKYNGMTEYEKKSCHLSKELNFKLNKTIKLSYDDSWFENKNIENDIKDIESLLKKLDEFEKTKQASPVKRFNFLNHANQYFAKYNGTGRFNIGLGGALFNAPDIINPVDFTVDLSQFTSATLEPQSIQDEFNIPSGKKLSPVIIATMPWVDATLTLPEYSKSSTYVSTINTWSLPLEEEQTQHGFLSRTTIESHYKIDYDINMTVKIFSLLQDTCPYWCYRLNNATRDKNIELAIGVGTTDIKLTKTFKTDIREQIDLNGGYSQLASSHQLENEETIDHSMQYMYVGGHYYMADQIRLEAYWKRYKSDYKKGEIQLTSKSSWGISVVYLFF